MALSKIAGVAKQLTFTAVTPATASGPLLGIQSWSFSDDTTLAAFRDNDCITSRYYQEALDGSLTIETTDFANWSEFAIGDLFTTVKLEVYGARLSNGVNDGDNITFTLSNAVVTAKSTSGDNSNFAPRTCSLTFKLARHANTGAEPTQVWAAAV